MVMEATAIRFGKEEKSWIQACADLNGKSFSEFVREAALEKVEDAADVRAYLDSMEQDDGRRYSMDEVMRMAMMAE